MADKYPKVTINTLEKTNVGAVYVLNKTKGDGRSAVQFTVPKASGTGTDAVIVPVTFIPINLTEQVAKRQLLASADFRKALSRGLLQLISEEEANDLLSTPNAVREVERLQKEMLAAAGGEVEVSTGVRVEDEKQPVPEGVGARIANFVMLLPDVQDENEALNTVMSMGELSEPEKAYIKKAAQEKGFMELVAYLDQ